MEENSIIESSQSIGGLGGHILTKATLSFTHVLDDYDVVRRFKN